jgi:hypothetical protein
MSPAQEEAMKPSTFVLAVVLLGCLVGCQGQCVRHRVADAVPAPSATAASEEPTAALPGGDVSPAAPAEDAGPSASPKRGRPTAAPAPEASQPPVGAQEAAVPPPPTPVAAVRRPEPIVLPAGTELPVRLEQTLASDVSRPRERVAATLTADVSANGRVAFPAGSEVIGHVAVAQQSGRVKGRARLVVAFDTIRAQGKSYPIDAPPWDITAGSSRDRDAKIAGGAAAVGAIIGGIRGGGKGALKGGAIGGAAGGAAALVTRGEEVELPAGSKVKITLRQELTIE